MALSLGIDFLQRVGGRLIVQPFDQARSLSGGQLVNNVCNICRVQLCQMTTWCAWCLGRFNELRLHIGTLCTDRFDTLPGNQIDRSSSTLSTKQPRWSQTAYQAQGAIIDAQNNPVIT